MEADGEVGVGRVPRELLVPEGVAAEAPEAELGAVQGHVVVVVVVGTLSSRPHVYVQPDGVQLSGRGALSGSIVVYRCSRVSV